MTCTSELNPEPTTETVVILFVPTIWGGGCINTRDDFSEGAQNKDYSWGLSWGPRLQGHFHVD